MQKIYKFQVGGELPVQTKKEYFRDALFGNTPDTVEEQVDYNQGNDIPLESLNNIWGDKDIKKLYQDKYGDKAFDKLKTDYSKVEKNYNKYEGLLSNYNLNKSIELESNSLYGKEIKKDVGFYLVDKSDTHATNLDGIYTSDKVDPRDEALNRNNFWVDDIGEKHDISDRPGFFQSIWQQIQDVGGVIPTFSSQDPTNNSAYTDKNGNEIKNLVYVSGEELAKKYPEKQFDKLNRGTPYLEALYYGEEIGGREAVSKYDYMGVTKPQLESHVGSSIVSALPRSLYKSASGIEGGIANTMMAIADLGGVDNNDYRKMLEGAVAESKASSVSSSVAAKKDFFNSENMVGFIPDVAVQLTIGGSIARGATLSTELLASALPSAVVSNLGKGRAAYLAGKAAVTNKVLGKTATGIAEYIPFEVTAGKYASVTALTAMAVSDARDQAIAAGFTPEQAALYQLAAGSAMAVSNYAFSWVDKGLDAAKFTSDVNKKVLPNLAHTVEGLKNATSSVEKQEILDKGVKSYFTTVKNTLSKVSGSKILASDPAKEAMQEYTEHGGETLAKGFTNLVYGKEGEKDHGFKSTSDIGYWSQYWSEAGMSAVGGFVGGAIAKPVLGFFQGARDDEDRNSLTSMILKGEGSRYLDMLSSMKENGALGSKNLSVEIDPDTKQYKSKDSAPTAYTHAEANYQLLLNEYNAITNVIKGLGADKVSELIKDKDFKDVDLAGMAIDRTKELTLEYLQELSKSPSLMEAALDETMVFKSNEDKEKYFKGVANTYNTSVESVEKLFEIKKEIKEITSGKATEKFILKKMMFNTVFDKSSDTNKPYEKYGDAFLENTIEAFYKRKERNELITKEKLAVAKENEENIIGLKNDFTNMDDFKGVQTLTVKGKNDVIKKYNEYNANLEQEIKNKVSSVLIPSYLSIDNNEELLNKIEKSVPNLEELSGIDLSENSKKELYDLATDIYLQATQNALGNINSIESYNEFNATRLDPSKILTALYGFASSDTDYEHIFEKSELSPQDLKDLKKLAKDLGDYSMSLAAKATDFSVEKGSKKDIEDLKQLELRNSEIESFVNTILNKAEDENKIIEEQNNFSVFYDEIFGDDKNLELGNSIKLRMESLRDEYAVEHNGVKIFDNVDETKYLLEQYKLKQDLLNGLGKYHKYINTYKNTFANIEEFVRNESLKNDKKIQDVFNERTLNIGKSFSVNKTFYDNTLHRILQRKVSDKTIKPEEQKMLDALDATFESLFKVKRDINNTVKELQTFLQKAEENYGKENELVKRKNAASNSVKHNVESLHNFILSSKEELLTKEVKAKFDEFNKWYLENYKKEDKSDATLAIDNSKIYELYDVLRTIPQSSMEPLLIDFKNSMLHIEDKEIDAINRIAIASKFHIPTFNYYYNELIKDAPYAAYKNQEVVALTVAAHVSTDLSSMMSRIYSTMVPDVEKTNLNTSSVLLLLGTAGSGKSTFGIGIGISIANTLMGNKKNSIVLTSNVDNQVSTLTNTAKDFKFSQSVENSLTKGKLDNLISTLENALKEKTIKADKTPNLDLLKDIKVIVYDEATIPSEFAIDKEDRDKSIYKLNRLLNALDKLDLPIKIVFSGDDKQNGYAEVVKQGSGAGSTYTINYRNIGNDKKHFFRTPYLDVNIRAKVQAISSFAKLIKSSSYVSAGRQMGNTVDNPIVFESIYGTTKDNTLLGVQIVKESEFDIINNDAFIKNIEDKILKYNETGKKTFTVGLVFNDFFQVGKDNFITKDGNSKLEILIKKYPKSFKDLSHEAAQGETFDYTICSLDSATFKDGASWVENGESASWTHPAIGETYVSKKFGTTLERSRFYTLVLNRTGRRFDSKEDMNLSVVTEEYSTSVADEYKKYSVKIDPTYINKPNTVVVQNEEKPVEETTEKDVISDAIYNTFLGTYMVPDEILNDIADKLIMNTPLSIREEAIWTGKAAIIENLISAKTKNTVEPETVVDDYSKLEELLLRVGPFTKEEQDFIDSYKNVASQFNVIINDENLSDVEKASKIDSIKEEIESKLTLEDVYEEDINELDLDLSEAVNNVEEEVDKKEASAIQKAYFDDLGLVSAFTNTKNNLKGHTAELQPQVLASILSEEDNGLFSYELVNEKISGTNAAGSIELYNTGFIKATLLKDIKGRKAGSFTGIRIFTPNKETTEDKEKVSLIEAYLQKLESGSVELSHKQLKNIVRYTSPGNVKSSKQETNLKAFLKDLEQKNPGIKMSDKIYIDTTGESKFRGNGFLLYTYNPSVDLDEDYLSRLNFIDINLDSINKKFKKLKNGVGIIRLNTKPVALKELYESFQEKAKDGDNFILDDYLKGNSATQLLDVLAKFLDIYNKSAGDESIQSNLQFILSKADDKIFGDKFEQNIKTVIDNFTNSNSNVLSDLTNFLQAQFQDANVIDGAEENEKLSIKSGKLFGYKLNKNGTQFSLFNTNTFMKFIKENDTELMLDLISSITNSSHKFKNGLYPWPQVRKSNKSGQAFGILDRDLFQIKDSTHDIYSVKVENIEQPLLYFSLEELVKTNQVKKKVEQLEPVVKISKYDTLLNNINNASLDTIESLIDSIYTSNLNEKQITALELIVSKKQKDLEADKSIFDKLNDAVVYDRENLLEVVNEILDMNISVEQINEMYTSDNTRLENLILEYHKAKNDTQDAIAESIKANISNEINPNTIQDVSTEEGQKEFVNSLEQAEANKAEAIEKIQTNMTSQIENVFPIKSGMTTKDLPSEQTQHIFIEAFGAENLIKYINNEKFEESVLNKILNKVEEKDPEFTASEEFNKYLNKLKSCK